MNKDKKRLNLILVFGSISIALLVCFAIVTAIFISKYEQAKTAQGTSLETLRKTYHNLGFSAILLFCVIGGITLALGISILKIKWDAEWMQKYHARYGIIIIILSFLIAGIVFVMIYYFKSRKNSKEIQNINFKTIKNKMNDFESFDESEKLTNLKNINETKI